MLLKGLQDVEVAPDPGEAAEMVILRIIHAADMPDPIALVQQLSGDTGSNRHPRASGDGARSQASTSRLPSDFPALISLLERNGRHLVAQQLHDQVGLVRYQPPDLALKPWRPLGPDWTRELAAVLKSVTGSTWSVSLSSESGEATLLEQEKIAEERVRNEVLNDPNVRQVMDAFPGSELESYSSRGA